MKTKWGYKNIDGPFPDCNCPSHTEAGEYPIEDFESGIAVIRKHEDKEKAEMTTTTSDPLRRGGQQA